MELNEVVVDGLKDNLENVESEDTMELPEESLVDNNSTDHIPDDESQEEYRGVKRNSGENGQHRRKRRKSFNINFTNPLMKLNELKPGLVYMVESKEGPPHNPVFCASVEVNEQKFYGKGNSKQKAKHEAARQALMSFIQFKDAFSSAEFMSSGTHEQDFASSGDATQNEVATNGSNEEKKSKVKKNLLEDVDKKNPCVVLNSLQPGLLYELQQENLNNPNKRFQMTVIFEDEKYEGFGPNKKAAKAAAARALLAQKFNIHFNTSSIISGDITDEDDKEVFNFPQNVADAIDKAVFDKFSEVMSVSQEYAKWKVLAGIVMSQDENMENLQVISFGTGTKHLNGEYMSMNGGSINDCHAEIISRRCLKEFFYSQLELYLQSKGDESIFEQKSDGKFVMKPNYRFHLYISTSPCGDARVFSVHDEDSKKTDLHPNRKARGLLRTKIESGEGTIPVKKEDSIQTWDGIIQGQQRYLTMSCSDKVASWNILGLQGCLLSHLVEPIYLHSIVLGRLFHPTHMRRAVFNRFEGNLKDLPDPYHLTKPKLCAVTNVDSRLLSSSPNYSVNWTVNLDSPEVVIARTGKTAEGKVSRISKSSLFKRFVGINSRLQSCIVDEESTYADVKNLMTDYRKTKSQMILALASGGYGHWVAKPVEQDFFVFSQ